MAKLGLLFALALIAVGQSSKPSPIGYTRAQAAAIATARSAKEPESPHSPNSNPVSQKGRDAENGTACFYRQKPVSSDEPEPQEMAFNASHPTLPLGTQVRVTNLANKKTVIVTVSERSAVSDHVICVNYPAAEKLGLVKSGVAQVHLEKL